MEEAINSSACTFGVTSALAGVLSHCPSSLHIPLLGTCCAHCRGIQRNWELDLLDAEQGRDLQQRAVPKPEPSWFFPARGLERSLLGPHSSGAKAEAAAQTGVGCAGLALIPWDRGHSGAGQWEGAKFGAFHDPASHLCVCVWILPGTNTDPGPSRALPPFPARGERWERHQTPRTLFQGEKCPFRGLWSLSGILGKFFLVKDSPPLPCSGRCLYGAFQVPEELWEDFLFPFCYMAESQMSLGQSQEDLISPLKP